MAVEDTTVAAAVVLLNSYPNDPHREMVDAKRRVAGANSDGASTSIAPAAKDDADLEADAQAAAAPQASPPAPPHARALLAS